MVYFDVTVVNTFSLTVSSQCTRSLINLASDYLSRCGVQLIVFSQAFSKVYLA